MSKRMVCMLYGSTRILGFILFRHYTDGRTMKLSRDTGLTLRVEVVGLVAYDQAGEAGTVATDSDPAGKESSDVAANWAVEENDLGLLQMPRRRRPRSHR